MDSKQQHQLDSLHRVQDFLNAHADTVGPLQTSEARKQLDTAVTQIHAHTLDQGTATLDMAGLKNRRDSLAAVLKTRHVQPIAILARAKLRGVPDFAALAAPIPRAGLHRLVHAARAMAVAATAHADAIAASGLGADAVAQLSAATDALDAAMADVANAKVGRVGATRGLAVQLGLGREAVHMLHAAVLSQFGDDATLLAGWRAAHRVTATPRAAKPAAIGTTSTTTMAPTPAPTPPAPPASVASSVVPFPSPVDTQRAA